MCGGLFAAYAFWQAGMGAWALKYAGGWAADGTGLPAGASLAPPASALAGLRLAATVLFFHLALRLAQKRGLARAMARAIFRGIAAHAALAITLPAAASVIPGEIALARGVFANPNSLATYLGMGLVLGVSLLVQGRREEPLAGAGVALIFLALLLTGSRAGIAASLVACGAVALAPGGQARRAWPLLGAAGITGLAALAFHTGVIAGDEYRWPLFAQVARAIASRPLTGFGLDSFPLLFAPFQAPPLPADVVWEKAHSSYLSLWAEAGLVAGSLPLLAGLIAAAALARHARACLPGRALAIAGLGALVLAALHSTVDFSLEIQANLFLLAALVALGLGAVPAGKEEPA
jgi:O-antigen ligase